MCQNSAYVTFIVESLKLLTMALKRAEKINKYQKLVSLFHLPVDGALVVSGARMQRA
jgi:hypothetical protein